MPTNPPKRALNPSKNRNSKIARLRRFGELSNTPMTHKTMAIGTSEPNIHRTTQSVFAPARVSGRYPLARSERAAERRMPPTQNAHQGARLNLNFRHVPAAAPVIAHPGGKSFAEN